MMNLRKLLGAAVLCTLGLLAGGCSLHGPGMSAYADDGPGYRHAMVEDDDGLPPEDAVLPRPMYGYPGGYVRHVGYRRGAPHCPGGTTWSGRYGKCVGAFHDIGLSAAQRDELASCGRIETRTIRVGNRLLQQQRGHDCRKRL